MPVRFAGSKAILAAWAGFEFGISPGRYDALAAEFPGIVPEPGTVTTVRVFFTEVQAGFQQRADPGI